MEGHKIKENSSYFTGTNYATLIQWGLEVFLYISSTISYAKQLCIYKTSLLGSPVHLLNINITQVIIITFYYCSEHKRIKFQNFRNFRVKPLLYHFPIFIFLSHFSELLPTVSSESSFCLKHSKVTQSH